MDPILAGLRLRYPLEIKPRPYAVGITACSNIPECPSTIDLDNLSGLQVTKTKQMIYDIAVIFHLVVQRFGPEPGLGVWVACVEGHLQPYVCHQVIVARTATLGLGVEGAGFVISQCAGDPAAQQGWQPRG